jgi:tetratricopeptide (TPR) repeat protein
MWVSLRTGCLVGAAALCLPAAVYAQQPGSAEALNEAKRLYAEGASLFKQGKFREAADRFQAAYNLDPSPILLYNLARAAEEMGDAHQAIDHYKAYLARYPQAEDRDEVQRRIRVLEAVTRHNGRLVLENVPAGANVTFNDAPPPAADADGSWALAPGRYAVRVQPQDGAPWAQDVDVRSDETLKLSYASDGAGVSGTAGLMDRPLLLGGCIAGGVGVALAGGALYFGLQSSAATDDFHRYEKQIQNGKTDDATLKRKNQAQDDARSDARIANILWGVAGAAAATGVTLLILDLTGQPSQSGGTALVPVPGGVGLIGTF